MGKVHSDRKIPIISQILGYWMRSGLLCSFRDLPNLTRDGSGETSIRCHAAFVIDSPQDGFSHLHEDRAVDYLSPRLGNAPAGELSA